LAQSVLVDTGPLVALFDPSDRDHERCRDKLDQLHRVELVTSLAVVTETTFLLDFSTEARRAFLLFLSAGAVRIEPFGAADMARASALMDKYADQPMDFADATLVVLADRLDTRSIFTIDGDFRVYRIGRKAFRWLLQ
jgi:predicted nucleic acid-binding protein